MKGVLCATLLHGTKAWYLVHVEHFLNTNDLKQAYGFLCFLLFFGSLRQIS